MKMDADSSGTEHRDSRGSRSRSWREREHHGRTSERDSRKKEHKIPYFADEVREQDRIRRLPQRAHQSTRRTRSRSRSQSSDRGSGNRRHRQRSRSPNRSREHHGRTSERDSRKKEHKIPYFADEVREQDRIRRLRQRAHQSTRRTCSRSRSQSSDQGSRHSRHRQRSRSRNRSQSRSSERRRRQRSPHRYNPPPKIINYYVQVPPQDFYGMSGMQQSFGYQRLPRPPPFPPAPFRYRQRQPFMGAPRFGYRNAGRPPY
uniref:Female-specific protein transformer n=1 Tax=Drosophila sechellia TaxID=7238 RepID=Q86LR5_DROSE|nr:transformer [Drosophila sechellia]